MRTWRWVAALLIPIAVASAEPAASKFGGPFDDLQLCSKALAQLADRIEKNRFAYLRGLLEYRETFGGDFWLKLVRVKPGEQWLDAGSGAGIAMAEYQTGRSLSLFKIGQSLESIFPLESAFPAVRANTKGVVVKLPEQAGEFRDAVKAYAGAGKHAVLEGRKIEDIPAEELGKSKLITDYFGPVTYSTSLDRVINKYLEIGSEGTDIYLKFTVDHHLIELKDGRRLKLHEYLKERLTGHSVTVLDHVAESTAHIQLREGGVKSVPKLTLKEVTSEGLPTFYYREE